MSEITKVIDYGAPINTLGNLAWRFVNDKSQIKEWHGRSNAICPGMHSSWAIVAELFMISNELLNEKT